MKKNVALLFLGILSICCLSFINWHHNLEEARQLAKKEHKYILLNFSGSDWCGPCIRLHKEVFGSELFSKYAEDNLVMVNADFPRLKKNQLSAEQQKINNDLADRYNSHGIFPLTLLLNEDGKVLAQWDGFIKKTPEDLIESIKIATGVDK